ncbi:MAG: hypothetical protein AB7O39_03355 [Flavobacteriaceae bacterium]
MNTPHIPTSMQNTRGTPRDMVRPALPFIAHNEFLLCLWRYNGEIILAEHTAEAYATPADALAAIPDDCISVAIYRPFAEDKRERHEDVTEVMAGAWLDRNGDDCVLPPFVHESAAVLDYRDTLAEPSIAEENRLGKRELGVA